MAEFVAFADEAGALHINDRQDFCFVSGFIAEVPVWGEFDAAWRERLEPGAPFSSKVFFSRDGAGRRRRPYHEWDDLRAAQYVNSLIDVVRTHPIVKVGGAVDVAAFRRYSLGERMFLTGARFENGGFKTPGFPVRPYFVAFHSFIWHAMNSVPQGSKIRFVFCRSEDRLGWSKELYADIGNLTDRFGYDNRLGQLLFAYPQDEPGLQAADLRVHLWSQVFERQEAVSKDRLEALTYLEGDTRSHGVYDSDHMEESFRKLPLEQLKAMRAYRPGSRRRLPGV